jgi:hypothetical protein
MEEKILGRNEISPDASTLTSLTGERRFDPDTFDAMA